jgi:beta-phosphoglucomutase-like phosphatase (HAD superfamily)
VSLCVVFAISHSLTLSPPPIRLLDFTTLAELPENWDRNLHMVEENYSERTAFHHVRRLRALLNPANTTSSVYVDLTMSEREKEFAQQSDPATAESTPLGATAEANTDNRKAQIKQATTSSSSSVVNSAKKDTSVSGTVDKHNQKTANNRKSKGNTDHSNNSNVSKKARRRMAAEQGM